MVRHSGTILLVDDEISVLAVLVPVLECEGFEVFSASDHDAAVMVFNHHATELDLLIADVSLPGKNGIELAEELLSRKRNLKVLFISGYVGAEVLRFHNIPKADLHFLPKPFAAGEFIQRVEQVQAAPDRVPGGAAGQNDRGAGADKGR